MALLGFLLSAALAVQLCHGQAPGRNFRKVQICDTADWILLCVANLTENGSGSKCCEFQDSSKLSSGLDRK